MGFGIKAAVINAIKAKTDNLPADPAGQTDVNSAISTAHSTTNGLVNTVDAAVDAILTDTSDMQPRISRIMSFMDFWSDQADKITIAGAAADLDFPSVTVAGLPSGVTLARVVAMLKVRAIKDTSAADNYIDQAGKTIRVKESTGAWGTDDLVAINFDQNQWYTTASTKENGDVMIGDNDVKTEVDGAAGYNFRSEQTNRGDAISALADNLELYDVQMGLRVYFTG